MNRLANQYYSETANGFPRLEFMNECPKHRRVELVKILTQFNAPEYGPYMRVGGKDLYQMNLKLQKFENVVISTSKLQG